MNLKKEKKTKKKTNWLRVLWITCMYLSLIGILVLVIIYKVKFEG